MSRLIDADALIEALQNEPKYSIELPVNIGDSIQKLLTVHQKMVVDVVKKQPTAYDVDAVEQGLPVAIGSDVYFIPSKVNYDLNVLGRHEENNRVYHQKVERITFTEHGWYLECDINLEYGVDHILVDKFYKETWFTMQEEAEQALSEMNRSCENCFRHDTNGGNCTNPDTNNICGDYVALKQMGE